MFSHITPVVSTGQARCLVLCCLLYSCSSSPLPNSESTGISVSAPASLSMENARADRIERPNTAHLPKSTYHFERMDGISLEAPSSPIEAEEMRAMAEIGANWVSLMPYAAAAQSSPEIRHNYHYDKWWGESEEGLGTCIDMAHEAGMRVMVKPHLWIHNGHYTGDVSFETEAEWKRWEQTYTDYLMIYARQAEEKEVEMLCIGTELKNHVNVRPDYWLSLIKEVRTIYSGQLTYAGNWDSYVDFPHWDKLDLIGVDAYFPISDAQEPTVEECREGWKNWSDEMQQLSDSLSLQVIFTEYGYRSNEYCAARPWETGKGGAVSEAAQANALRGLYDSVWREEWMVGGFLWKWHVTSHLDEDRLADRFTPQGKMAEEVVKDTYGR